MSAKPKPRRVQSKAARNERRKAAASTFIALGVTVLAAAFFQPLAAGRLPQIPLLAIAVLLFVVSQAVAHYILSRLED